MASTTWLTERPASKYLINQDYGEGYNLPGPGPTPGRIGMYSWAEMAPMVVRDIEIAQKAVAGGGGGGVQAGR